MAKSKTRTAPESHFSDVVQEARTKRLAELGDLSTMLLTTTADFVTDPDSMEFEDIAETLAYLAGGFAGLVQLLTVANDERNNARAAQAREDQADDEDEDEGDEGHRNSKAQLAEHIERYGEDESQLTERQQKVRLTLKKNVRLTSPR